MHMSTASNHLLHPRHTSREMLHGLHRLLQAPRRTNRPRPPGLGWIEHVRHISPSNKAKRLVLNHGLDLRRLNAQSPSLPHLKRRRSSKP